MGLMSEYIEKRMSAKEMEEELLRLNCGFEIDLSGIKNEIEAQSGKKIIL
jgi:hypothetical protein